MFTREGGDLGFEFGKDFPSAQLIMLTSTILWSDRGRFVYRNLYQFHFSHSITVS